MIVYEYTRSNTGSESVYCVCLYRKRNENQYAYRFIKGSADDTIFHPDHADLFSNGTSSHDILRTLFVNDDVNVSSQIESIIDYRDIIQGDYQNLRKRNKKSSFISYPRDYGIAKSSAQHLGVLTSVVLRHDKLLAHFKTMLVDCFLRDQISFQHAPFSTSSNSNKNNTQNDRLIDDLRSLKAFEHHHDAIKNANEKALHLLQSWQTLDSNMQLSHAYLAKIQTENNQLNHLKTSLEQQHQKLKQSYDQKISHLKSQVNETNIAKNSNQKHLDELNKKNHDYEKQNIIQKSQALTNLDAYANQLNQQMALLDDLQQSSDKQKRNYDANLLKISNQLNDATTRSNSQIEIVRQNADDDIQQAQLEKDEQQQKNAQRLHRLDEKHREQLADLQAEAEPIKLAIEMINHHVRTEDEKAQKTQLDDELTQANQQASQWRHQMKTLQVQIADANKANEHLGNEIRRHEQLADKFNANIRQLERQLNPDSGSLLSFLKSSPDNANINANINANANANANGSANDGWQQNIAKLINPELIHRTDLSPQWYDDKSNEVYGLTLHLDAIDMPEFAENDLQLRERIGEEVAKLDEVNQRLADNGKSQTDLRHHRHSLDAQKASLDNQLNHNDDTIDAINSRIQAFENACAKNRQQRHQEQLAKLAAHEAQIQTLRQTQTAEREQTQTENHARLTLCNDTITSIKTRQDADIDNKKELITQAQQQYQQRQASLEQAYQQALKEEGIDTDTLNQVKQEAERLDALYQQTKGYEVEVEKYQRWRKVEWAEAPHYQATIHELEDKLKQLDDDIITQQQAQRNALADINHNLTQTCKRLNNLHMQQASIEGWQTKARPYIQHLQELNILYYQAKLSEQLPALATLSQQKQHGSDTDGRSQMMDAPAATEMSNTDVDDIDLPILPIEQTAAIPSVNLDSGDVPWLISIDKLVPDCQRALDKIKQTANVLHNDMTQHVGSRLHQAWQNRQNQYKTQRLSAYLGHSNQTEAQPNDTVVVAPEVIALLDVMSLQMVVNEELIQLQNSIHSSFVTIGLHISNYYGSLNTIKNKISHIGKKLATDINTQHQFPALSDIRIELTSKIHEYAIWQDLERFNRLYQDWQLTSNELPNDAFINSFEQVMTSFKQSQIELNIDSLVEMTIQITENGRRVPIKTDNDLQNASSTGLSMLAVIVVFCGMTRYLCRDEDVTIHWPLDEIGKLSGKNTVLLFELMKQYNVTLFCAQPDASPVLNQFFINKNLLDIKRGVRQFEIKRPSGSNPLLEKTPSFVHHSTATPHNATADHSLTDATPHLSSPHAEVTHEPNL